MTLKELIEKLNKIAKRNHIDIDKQIVTDAWIAGKNDANYPPGTILFDCLGPDGYGHILYVCPDKISIIQ